MLTPIDIVRACVSASHWLTSVPFAFRPLKKMAGGMIFAALAFGAASLVEWTVVVCTVWTIKKYVTLCIVNIRTVYLSHTQHFFAFSEGSEKFNKSGN